MSQHTGDEPRGGSPSTDTIGGSVDGLTRSEPASWQRLRLVVHSTVGADNAHLEFTLADGSTVGGFAGVAVLDMVDDLRHEMYQPGRGTWFTTTIEADVHGTHHTDFDYDAEPTFDFDITPASFVQELRHFPRDPEHIPAWLTAKTT